MTLWKTVTVAVVILAAGLSAARAQPARAVAAPSRFTVRADALMKAYIDADSFSGVALVALDGKVLFRRDYGLANRELGVPNGKDTKYRIASLTKQFTAAAILQLVETGKVRLDDPISQYYPAAPQAWSKVTLRHLLSHQSGIYNYTDGMAADPAWFEVSRTPRELVALSHDKPLQFSPGTNFRYTNTGYVLLGMVIEQASGQSYASYLKDHIFEPLGMADTGYDDTSVILPGRASGYAKVGDRWVHPTPMSLTVPFAAGGLYSTADDLLKWDSALHAFKPLSQASVAAMFTDYGGATGFGYGVGKSAQGQVVWSHGGGIGGFSSAIQHMPEDRLTVIVLSNEDGAPTTKIATDLADIFHGVEPRMSKASVTLPTATLDRYVGVYTMGSNEVTITREGNRLSATIPGRPPLELAAESDRGFFARTAEVSLTFAAGPGSEGVDGTITVGSRQVALRRKPR